MNNHILAQVDAKLQTYQSEHQGEEPLYILVSPDEVLALTEDVRELRGYDKDVPITSYKGIKIMSNEILQPGQIVLSNDLPETGS